MSTDSPLYTTASICCYYGVGCDVLIEHDDEHTLGVWGDLRHPANFGRLCSKGANPHLTGDLQARASHPQLRLDKQMARAHSDWESVLEYAAGRFAETIREHGPDSVAFYISGQLLTEDYYAFNKLAWALIGTNNIDSNLCLCMPSAVVGYKRSLGADALPCSYEDLDCADCVLIVGSNMTFAHPVLFRRLETVKAARPETRIVVTDSWRTDTCELVDLHLVLPSGTNVALFHGILHTLLWEDWIDHSFIAEHTEGFADLKELVHDYISAAIADICGIDRTDLQRCAE